MLDLTAAFDTVDPSVLITHQDSVLQWFSSCLTNRNFVVMIDDVSSSTAPLTSVVPQGSILGPILLSVYATAWTCYC